MRRCLISFCLTMMCACHSGDRSGPPSETLTPSAEPSASAAKLTPEALAARMTGTVACKERRCKAGEEVCVSAPREDHVTHCERIVRWGAGRTPVPENGSPAMAGLTACEGSQNCPEGSLCCLHEVGHADVQAIVCHASVNECRDRIELCGGEAAQCRTAGTVCRQSRCVPPGETR